MKVAIVAPYPAVSILPIDKIKKRYREKAKKQHPAPWVKTLCNELKQYEDIKIEIITHSRYINKVIKTKLDGIQYHFVPKYEPAKIDPYHMFIPARIQFTKIIRKCKPNIVHGFGAAGQYGLITVLQKRPKIVFIQGIMDKIAPFSHKKKLEINILKKIERYVIKKADGIIAETEFAHDWAKNINPRIEVKIIPHAYLESFYNAQPNFMNKRIICVGTLSRIKGCATVLEAFAIGVRRSPDLFKSAELLFVGNGPLKEKMLNKVKKDKIEDLVKFAGNITHDKIIYQMENALMLAIGSRMDTSPNVITEAHAVGIPVVCTNVGGIPDMVENGRDGFIVNVNDAEEMSKRMEILLADRNICKIMGQKAKNKIKELNSPTRVGKEHIDFYKKIIKKKAIRIPNETSYI